MNRSTDLARNIEVYEEFYQGGRDYRRKAGADRASLRQLFRIMELPVSPPRILELGTGTGYYLGLIRTMFSWPVYGTDISYNALKTARRRYDLREVALMDTYKLAFTAGAFDVVIANGHNPFNTASEEEIVSLIRDISKLIRREGYFVFIWSSNLSDTTSRGKLWASIHNHSRAFMRSCFWGSEAFSGVKDYAFIRPFCMLWGSWLLTELNSRVTEFFMRVGPRRLSAKLVVLGKRR